jgi:hypothetical protein
MERIIAACGLVCSECPAYVATQTGDEEAIAKMAADAAAKFDREVKPEEVLCDGCLTESERKCGYIADCEIRACAVERGFANCAHCGEYACEKLTGFMESASGIKEILDGIRTDL